MNSFVTDTQALVKFMMGKKVINDRSHNCPPSNEDISTTLFLSKPQRKFQNLLKCDLYIKKLIIDVMNNNPIYNNMWCLSNIQKTQEF